MIDWKRVEDLKAEIGFDGFAEVADMFLEEAEAAVQALGSDLRADDVEAQLHFLKGSALNLGLTDLAGICQLEERRVAAGQRDKVDPARIAAVYQASRAQLMAGIAPPTG